MDILKKIYRYCQYLLDSLIVIFRPRKTEAKILLIRLDGIGDFILWLDAARHFREIYPDKKIVLMGNRLWTGMARKMPYWDEVWELDRRKFYWNMPYRMRMLKKVRQAGFSIVIQPTYSREFLCGDAIVRISGAEKRIGSAGDYNNIKTIEKKISDKFYTQLIPITPGFPMELKQNMEFLKSFGHTFQSSLPDITPVTRGIKNPVAEKSPYFVLFPGASWTGKQWPLENFSELALRVFHETGFTPVICGGKTEKNAGEILSRLLDIPYINMVGKTDLAQLATVIKDARFVLSNDTSAVHIASAVSTPVFCFLGGGHYKRFLPYDIGNGVEKTLPVTIIHKMDCFNCDWNCKYPVEDGRPVPCIEKITVDDAWRYVKDICLTV